MATREQRSGKLQEKIVAGLEKHLNDRARVECDIFLPVLSSNSTRQRQVDIAILQGDPPRESLTIVEVQKRNRKVGPDNINAWLAKMREVGAQHLLCVSEAGFTKSVLEMAESIGPTLRLLTLQQVDDLGSVDLPPKRLTDFSRVSGIKYHSFVVEDAFGNRSTCGIDFYPKQPVIRLSDGGYETVDQFVEQSVMWRIPGISANTKFQMGEEVLVRIPKGHGVRVIRNDGWVFPVSRINFVVSANVLSAEFVYSSFEYRQLDHGHLLWCRTANAEMTDGTKLVFSETIKQVSPGVFERKEISLIDASEMDGTFYLSNP